MKLFNMWFTKKDKKTPLQRVTQEELDKNRAVFESLEKYDQGEKDISTVEVERHLRDLQHATQ